MINRMVNNYNKQQTWKLSNNFKNILRVEMVIKNHPYNHQYNKYNKQQHYNKNHKYNNKYNKYNNNNNQ